MQDFPGGPVVKNLPATAGDMGPIHGDVGSVQEGSTCYEATEPRVPKQENPLQLEDCTLKLQSSTPSCS